MRYEQTQQPTHCGGATQVAVVGAAGTVAGIELSSFYTTL